MFFTMLVFSGFAQSLSKAERATLSDHLKGTQSELLKTVKGLSNEQLHFKSQ